MLQIEKLFDVACTLTDVIACVPVETSISGEVPSDHLNTFLDLISRLRGGASRFLPLLLAKVSENLPAIGPVSQPAHGMPLQHDYADSTFSPSLSSQSAPLLERSPPISPYGPPPLIVSDPSLMFSGYSPVQGSNPEHGTTTLHGAPYVAAPIPRSVPRIKFDGYTG